jgi:hypothetical protein
VMINGCMLGREKYGGNFCLDSRLSFLLSYLRHKLIVLLLRSDSSSAPCTKVDNASPSLSQKHIKWYACACCTILFSSLILSISLLFLSSVLK